VVMVGCDNIQYYCAQSLRTVYARTVGLLVCREINANEKVSVAKGEEVRKSFWTQRRQYEAGKRQRITDSRP
jgi:hypothetical protein